MDPEIGVTETNNPSKFNFSSVPKYSRWLILIFIVVYILGAISTTISDFIGLKPAWIISRIWTTITSGFFHNATNFLELLINIMTVVIVTPLIDPIWGYWEILRFIFGLIFLCSVCTALLRAVLFFVLTHPTLLFDTIGGFFGVSTALVVALKQINPEKEWRIGALSIRAKYLPSTYLLTGLILFALPYTQSAAFEFSLFGLILSWIYLRYFQFRDGSYGDQSSQFKFETLFPEALHPFFDTVSRFCCCCLNRGKKKTNTILMDPTDGNNSSKDADRQRKLALKVLDDKFQTMKEIIPPPVQQTEQSDIPEIIQT